jgi:predicted DsbA family dithiol-disulfide isomerase/uncharacterized membrane protein
MTKANGRRWYLALGLTLLGLGCSAMLAWDYLVGGGAFCQEGGGCDLVRASRFSTIAGAPVPVLGLVYFACLAAALAAGRDRWFRFMAWPGAVAGASFLLVQALVVGALCPWCVVVDVAAIAIPLVCARPGISPLAARRLALAGPVLALSATALILTAEPPAASSRTVAHERPSALRTITEFSDFECPYCRRLHGLLRKVLHDYPGIQIARKHVPLARHRHAELAARVACCAEEMGKGDAMADRLFASNDLRRLKCLEMAEGLGLDSDELSRCIDSPRVDERLEADRSEARALGVRNLPSLVIGDQLLVGVPSEHQLRGALDALVAGRE